MSSKHIRIITCQCKVINIFHVFIAIKQVFLKLEELLPKDCSVAEPHFGGSLGKATDVIQSDLDLCVMVNKKIPPFDDEGGVLDKMEDILQQHQNELQIQQGSIKGKNKKRGEKPRVSIQFSFSNGIAVDLLPAANLLPNEVLAEIAKNPEKNYYIYNSSLVPSQIAFMKSHDSFTHSLIRLSKFWFKSLSFGDKKLFGGSILMELMGCAAAEDEKRSWQKPSMLRAFVSVLQMVCEINTIKIVFEPVSSQKRKTTWWRRIPLSELKARGKTLVPMIVGTTDILKRNCFIVDPANPYFDQLTNKDSTVIKLLQGFAFETKVRLANFMIDVFQSINQVPFDFVRIFEPQPAQLKTQYPSLQFPDDFCLGYTYPCAPPCFAGLIIRKKDIYGDQKKRLVIDSLMWDLLAVVHSVQYTFPGATTVENIQTSVDNLIELSFDIKDVPPGSHDDRHDKMDVTLCIPYVLKDTVYAVKFSMIWTK